jgi:hypothetical protein
MLRRLDTSAAEKAIERFNNVSYTTSTEGWQVLQNLKDDTLGLIVERVLSPSRYREIADDPLEAAYQAGFAEGLRFYDQKIRELERKAEKAKNDLEKYGHSSK